MTKIRTSEFLSGKPDIPKCIEIVEKWNEFAIEHGLSKVNSINTKRYGYIVNRIEESLFDIDKILSAASEQPFLMGKNDTGWKLNFDYLVRDPVMKSTYLKILEGGFK